MLPEENIRPRKIQMFIWPVVIRNRHAVGVAGGGGGKTLSYLVPLIHQLRHERTFNHYDSLPVSCGVSSFFKSSL